MREVDAVDGLDDAVHHVEVGPQVANVEERSVASALAVAGEVAPDTGEIGHSRHTLVRGSSASRRPSPMKLMPMHGERDGHAREERPPPVAVEHWYRCELAGRCPSVSWAFTPKLRKLTKASVTMTPATAASPRR